MQITHTPVARHRPTITPTKEAPPASPPPDSNPVDSLSLNHEHLSNPGPEQLQAPSLGATLKASLFTCLGVSAGCGAALGLIELTHRMALSGPKEILMVGAAASSMVLAGLGAARIADTHLAPRSGHSQEASSESPSRWAQTALAIPPSLVGVAASVGLALQGARGSLSQAALALASSALLIPLMVSGTQEFIETVETVARRIRG